MDIFDVLSLIGGLALFLYGIRLMGRSLEKVSGGRLERLLEKPSSSPPKAALLGAGVAALLQSSAAATVMVVGFVNSGIMELTQAAGIIIGANVGTTATSWILSLCGLRGNSFWSRMCSPSAFGALLAAVGVIWLFFVKSEKKKDAGLILMGFSILLFGMNTMTEAVRPLGEMPEFQGMFLAFSAPFLGIVAGAILTAILQSSTVSIGLLQALSVTGAVTYSAAIPIILGGNIGTCVSALISAAGASKNAKRAAAMHLYFNLIGSVVLLAAFYLLNSFWNIPFFTAAASPVGIAAAHTLFNLITAILILPFAGGLEKLACMTVKDGASVEPRPRQKVQIMDERFLGAPAFAIEQSRQAAVLMAQRARENLFEAMDLVMEYSPERVKKIGELETVVDRYEDELGSFLIKLSRKNLTEEDSHTLSILLHCICDFERISDHAFNIMESCRRMQENGVKFSEKAGRELKVLMRAVQDIVNSTFEVFVSQDTRLSQAIEPLEEVIDELNRELNRRHIRRLRDGECTIELGFSLADITTSLERVADHCSNIAVCISQVKEDVYDTHEYLDTMKYEDDGFFRGKVSEMQEKYILP
ncbi:MAG TPA: Na/Pi cotransporter family protein [Candidatus Pullilachnospira intestinigallinarum]|nr:Na/Pi cotransporter family protein [Candidatus Pullilachnospira intestinigallinarum]